MIVVDEGPGLAPGSYKQHGFITDGSSSTAHNLCESPRKLRREASPETGTSTSGGAVSPPLLDSCSKLFHSTSPVLYGSGVWENNASTRPD